MSSRPAGDNATWVIYAAPAAVLVFLFLAALVIIAVRPEKEPDESVTLTEPAPPPRPRTAAPPAAARSEPSPVPPTPATSPVPTAPLSSAIGSTAPAPQAPPGMTSSQPEPAATRPSPVPSGKQPTAEPIDVLASIDLGASAISGDWRREGAALRCTNASARNRAKLRLAPPPPGDGYDIAVTFTAQGDRRFVAQVLSFRGRQFIFAMFSSQSGFASVRGQNALANETTRNRGISAGTKHTSLIKVREQEVSAYLDGELLSSHATDYSDLDVSDAWNLGPSSARENLLGLAAECPVVIEAVTLTPLEPAPTSTPAPSSYKELATLISSPFSTESSAAATRPAARRPMNSAELRSLIVASQPVVSDIAADLLRRLGQPSTAATLSAGGTGDDAARDAFFRAVQLSTSPAAFLADPLLESRPPDHLPGAVVRADFDAEQARQSAWRTLIARAGDFYPDAKPQRDLVKLHLAPIADAARGRPAGFFATNAHAEPLANVTLVIEIVHAMTSPAPTAVHHYFIPRWRPAQRIFFPAICVPNVSSPELLDHPGPWPLNPLGGVIEARVQVWSDRLVQPSQTITFDANFQSIARTQLDEAYRLVDEALRGGGAGTRPGTTASQPPAAARPAGALLAGPIVPVRSDLSDDAPEFAHARAAARRARRLIPPQSSLADEARDLVAQPQAALRDLRKRQLDAFIGALTLRVPRPGVWVVHKPGVLARLARPAEREAALAEAGGAGGRLTLTVDGRHSDGGNVTVTLTSADQPKVQRRFSGRLQVDVSANRLLLNLRATQPPPSRPPTQDELKQVVHWTSLLLDLRNNTLCGIATAGPSDAVTVLNVSFAPPSGSRATTTGRPRPQRAK